MSWTDLFKSRSSSPKADPRVRWFGKLPTYPDYYRSTADEDWADEFNNWVLKGYELYRGRVVQSDRHQERLPVSACILRLPRSGMTVFASVLDYGGDMRNRPFPMCFYAAAPTARWRGPTSDRIAAGADVLRPLLGFGRDVARFLNSPGSFEAFFADRDIDMLDIEEGRADRSWEERAGKLPLSKWFDGAKAGLKTTSQDEWVRLATRWGDGIAAHEGKGFEPTLRFPLACGIPLDVQTAGWFRWLETRMDVARRNLSVVVSGDVSREIGWLSLIAREPMPDDFLLMTSAVRTLPYVDDLAGVGTASDAADASAEAHAPTEAEVPGEAEIPPARSESGGAAGVEQEAEAVAQVRSDAPEQSWLDFVRAPCRAA